MDRIRAAEDEGISPHLVTKLVDYNAVSWSKLNSALRVREKEHMYSDIVIKHLTHPRNEGLMDNPDAVGTAVSLECESTVTLYLRVIEERIVEVKFQASPCGAVLASTSLVTELLRGMTLDEALALTPGEIVKALGGLPPDKVRCAVLAPQALRNAIAHFRARSG